MKITEKDIIKGYQYEKNKYIVFKKEELEKLKPENEKEIDMVAELLCSVIKDIGK